MRLNRHEIQAYRSNDRQECLLFVVCLLCFLFATSVAVCLRTTSSRHSKGRLPVCILGDLSHRIFNDNLLLRLGASHKDPSKNAAEKSE
jgi:hypothetical protein